jgi:hypothetical protein
MDPGDENDYGHAMRGWYVFEITTTGPTTVMWVFPGHCLRQNTPEPNHDAGDEDDWLAYVPSRQRTDGLRCWSLRVEIVP